MKTNTFLAAPDIYKIYTNKTQKNDKHHTVPRYVYICDIPSRENQPKSN